MGDARGEACAYRPEPKSNADVPSGVPVGVLPGVVVAEKSGASAGFGVEAGTGRPGRGAGREPARAHPADSADPSDHSDAPDPAARESPGIFRLARRFFLGGGGGGDDDRE